MIKGKVVTHLDDYQREKWPTHFVGIPKTGHYIKSNSGKRLKVITITHANRDNNEPYIIIEVTK